MTFCVVAVCFSGSIISCRAVALQIKFVPHPGEIVRGLRGTLIRILHILDGVEKVEVTLEPGAATVQGNADCEKLISAVKEAGYEAELA